VKLGRNVAVIGGGDVAMDCARAAKRAPGVENVSILYRRTREYMTSSREEQELALADGVEFVELMSPVCYDGKTLLAEHMSLGERGADGRRAFVPTGKTETLEFDAVISAVGARADASCLKRNGVEVADDGYAELDEQNKTNIDGVYIAGDCRRGPATIVQAMADSKIIATDILRKLNIENDFTGAGTDADKNDIYSKKAVLCERCEGGRDAARCLNCGTVCEICCEVCPNRANISVTAGGRPQILHMDGMCNECGNCAVFCPHDGAPYRDKVTLFQSREAFMDSKNAGFVFLDSGAVYVRDERGNEFECSIDDNRLSPSLSCMMRAVRDSYGYLDRR
jgi:putative selenate reductase